MWKFFNKLAIIKHYCIKHKSVKTLSIICCERINGASAVYIRKSSTETYHQAAVLKAPSHMLIPSNAVFPFALSRKDIWAPLSQQKDDRSFQTSTWRRGLLVSRSLWIFTQATPFFRSLSTSFINSPCKHSLFFPPFFLSSALSLSLNANSLQFPCKALWDCDVILSLRRDEGADAGTSSQPIEH